MSQQQLFVPAAPGWYVRPGDPPDVTRHWDGRQWLCEIRGPIRDHFDHLRAKSLQGLTPEEQEILRRLTHDVSAIEDLVLASPTANPPLVEIAAPPPYAPPPIDPYTSVPIPAQGVPGRALPTSRRRGRVIALVVVVVLVLLVVVGKLFLSGVLSSVLSPAPPALSVGSCVTLSSPAGSKDPPDVTWAKSACTTSAGGPVSFTVIAVLDKTGTCDADSQYVQTFAGAKDVRSTYCLMENLTAGECLSEDAKGFYVDVACTDSRATLKVAQKTDQGSGVACAAGSDTWEFPTGNRTYCVAKV